MNVNNKGTDLGHDAVTGSLDSATAMMDCVCISRAGKSRGKGRSKSQGKINSQGKGTG